MGIFTRSSEMVPCTVEVSHRFESLHAHVRFNNGAVVYPGDEVLVHGKPIMAAYGEVIVEDREATITRAEALPIAPASWVSSCGSTTSGARFTAANCWLNWTRHKQRAFTACAPSHPPDPPFYLPQP